MWSDAKFLAIIIGNFDFGEYCIRGEKDNFCLDFNISLEFIEFCRTT